MIRSAAVVLACSLMACSGGAESSGDSGADSGGQPSDTDADTGTGTAPSGELETDIDVAYDPPDGGDPDEALLDVYYSPGGEGRRLLVFVHGGSWVGGDKGNLSMAPDLAPWFVDRGFVVAAVNFRLASPISAPQEVTWADQCEDVAAALAWLFDNAETWGAAGSGAVLVGYSSGAHLVALLSADESYLQLAGLGHEHLAASISLDVHAYDVPYALLLMQGSELEGNIPLIEWLFGQTEAEQLMGSPSAYVEGADVPPSLLISADPSDEETSKGYIAKMATLRHAQLLVDCGHQASSEHYDDETHSSLITSFGASGDGPTATVGAFLDDLSL